MAFERVALVLTLGAAALASPATAEDTRKLDVGLRARVERDTNVAQSSENLAQLRGLTPEDTIFTPSLNVDISIPVSRQTLFLRGAGGYTFYDKNTRLNRARVNVVGGAVGRAGPCAATVSGGLLIGQTELTDVALAALVENLQKTKTVALNVSCSRETGLGVVFSGSKDWSDNSLALLSSAESERASYMGGITYSRPTLGMVTLFANHQKTEYPNRFVVPGLHDGYELDAYGVTFSRQLGARIQGTITASYTKVNPAISALIGSNDFSGATYSGSLTYRASDRLRAKGDFYRSITPSIGLGQQYNLQTGYGLSVDYDIGSRILLTVGGGYNESEANGRAAPSPLVLTDSTNTTVFGALRYRHSDRLSFTLDARWQERDANAPQFDYTSNRVGVAADVAF